MTTPAGTAISVVVPADALTREGMLEAARVFAERGSAGGWISVMRTCFGRWPAELPHRLCVPPAFRDELVRVAARRRKFRAFVMAADDLKLRDGRLTFFGVPVEGV